MIKVVTVINPNRATTSKTECRNCNTTIEFGCFVPVICNKCRFTTPNYKFLVEKLEDRIEYYRKGTICGMPAY